MCPPTDEKHSSSFIVAPISEWQLLGSYRAAQFKLPEATSGPKITSVLPLRSALQPQHHVARVCSDDLQVTPAIMHHDEAEFSLLIDPR
jgi:hypothetical protein